jgi:ElaA protein
LEVSTPSFTWRSFDALTPLELHDVLALRSAVFVVEQGCLFQDVDGLDLLARHLLARDERGLAAYARILPPGARFETTSIGRVVVAPRARGVGLGRQLMEEALRGVEAEGPVPIALSAQAHLERFYASLGFVAGERYDEDGIPHVAMRRG